MSHFFHTPGGRHRRHTIGAQKTTAKLTRTVTSPASWKNDSSWSQMPPSLRAQISQAYLQYHQLAVYICCFESDLHVYNDCIFLFHFVPWFHQFTLISFCVLSFIHSSLEAWLNAGLVSPTHRGPWLRFLGAGDLDFTYLQETKTSSCTAACCQFLLHYKLLAKIV